jgi:hypothetical protein
MLLDRNTLIQELLSFTIYRSGGSVVDKGQQQTSNVGDFMNGTRYLSFTIDLEEKHSGSIAEIPVYQISIPINADTLYGRNSGVIRWSPTSNCLHLCYGPFVQLSSKTTESVPLLSTLPLLEPNAKQKMFEWYINTGRDLFKHRQLRNANASYAEKYALPGEQASIQLSAAQVEHLNGEIIKNMTTADTELRKIAPKTLLDLASIPVRDVN